MSARWAGLERHWPDGVVLACLGYAVFASFQEARWVEDVTPFGVAITLGLVFGALLAWSRFPAWFVAAYTLLMAGATLFDQVGRVLPGLFGGDAPAADRMWQLNARAQVAGLRVAGWVDAALAGEAVRDTGLFVGLVGLLLWAAMTWLAWWGLRRRRALAAVLLPGVALAVNTHLSRQEPGWLALFVGAAVLWAARVEFLDRLSAWDASQVDYAENLGPEWGVSAALLAIGVALVVWAGPWVGTPEGWKAIREWLRPARQETSELTEQLFGGVNTPPPEDSEAGVLTVISPDLSMVGAPLPTGDAVALRVQTSDPPPPPAQAIAAGEPDTARRHYWRNAVFAVYNGQGWAPPEIPEDSAEPVETTAAPPLGRYLLQQRYEILGRNQGNLFGVNQPVSGGAGVRLAFADEETSLPVGSASQYELVSWATAASAGDLRAAGQDYPEEVRRLYLQLPDSLPERVRELAATLAPAHLSPFDRALRIQEYLRANYAYDPGAGAAPAGEDAVDYFLFEQPTGFCSHFATAMAVLARASGAPARVASGYATGWYDYERGAWAAPVSAAHAWVEVYFPGIGWVEFEPTATMRTFTYPELDGQPAQPAGDFPEMQGRTTRTGWRAAAVVGGALALALGGLWWSLRPRRVGAVSGRALAARLYRTIRRQLKWSGLHSAPSATPDEFAHQAGPLLARFPGLREALAEATRLYDEAAYAETEPDALRAGQAGEKWQRAWREQARLWGQRWLRRRL